MSQKKRILIVDSEDLWIPETFKEEIMPDLDAEVVCCLSNEEAEEAIRENPNFSLMMIRKNNALTKETADHRVTDAGFELVEKIRSGDLGFAAKEARIAIVSQARLFNLQRTTRFNEERQIRFKENMQRLAPLDCLDPYQDAVIKEYVNDVLSRGQPKDWSMPFGDSDSQSLTL